MHTIAYNVTLTDLSTQLIQRIEQTQGAANHALTTTLAPAVVVIVAWAVIPTSPTAMPM
jgi:hypothetical protein